MIRFIERNVEWIVSCCVVLALVLGAVLYQQLQARDTAGAVATSGPRVTTEAPPSSTEAASGTASDTASGVASEDPPAEVSSSAAGMNAQQDIEAQ